MPMIGERIRQLRIERDLSQGDIEKASGLARCYISRVERGYTVPRLEALERFASALDVPFYKLFCNAGSHPASRQTPRRTFEELADDAGHRGAEARFLLRLRGLVRRMTDADRAFFVEVVCRLSSSTATKTGGPGERRIARRPAQPPSADSV